MTDIENYRKPIKVRPAALREGDTAFVIPRTLVEKHDETALGMQFAANRQVFGRGYAELHREYFASMPPGSGVFITGIVPIEKIIPGANFPGDIDLLVIPYEGNDLVVSKAMAIEIKVVRAKFSKQGKSPNDFGFSQAAALTAHGFPFVSVIHLIVSDTSPEEHWRRVLVARIIDAECGTVEMLGERHADLMPSDLIRRSYGRLSSNSPDLKIGLLAAYMEEHGEWPPEGRSARFNSSASIAVMDAIEDFYATNFRRFLDTPRYPPGD
ncbi:hypothetical protein ACU4GI_44825 [Cupriavidus basilensis]